MATRIANAAAFARLVHGKRAGVGKWMGRCPNAVAHAHNDRNRSLSISTSRDGKILLHCFGCNDTPAILRALGLDWSALFDDKPREEWEAAAVKQRADERKQRDQRRKIDSEIYRLNRLCETLAIQLLDASPGYDHRTEIFHRSLERLRKLEGVDRGR